MIPLFVQPLHLRLSYMHWCYLPDPGLRRAHDKDFLSLLRFAVLRAVSSSSLHCQEDNSWK